MVENYIILCELAREGQVDTFSFFQEELVAVVEDWSAKADTFLIVVDLPISNRSKTIVGDARSQLLDL